MATAIAKSNAIRLKYESEYDLLSAWAGAPQPVDNVEVEPGLSIRVSRETGTVVGLEMVDAAARTGKDADVLRNPAYVDTLLQRYGPQALDALHQHLG